LWWYRNRTKRPDQIFFVFLILLGAGRFLLDFTRDISADPHYWGLATSQWISILIFVVTGSILTKKFLSGRIAF
jgi:prolipoprotein diacylglyceryltransferase